MTAPHLFDVDVPGGALRVAAHGAPPDTDRPVVLAAHGISSSRMTWRPLARALGDEVCLLVPDLRGRGDSTDVAKPFGVVRHAEDLIAVLDAVDRPHAVLVGHSMGGFAVSVAAVAHPERVRRLVLVDGGAPFSDELGPDEDPDEVLARMIGPALERLDRTFDSREEYRAFWRDHPSFGGTGIADEDLDAYADHDLGGDPGAHRSRVVPDALRVDGRDLLTDPDVRGAYAQVSCPATLLWAERGMVDQPGGLYSPEEAERLGREHPHLAVRQVPDTNHYSIALAGHGAAAVADAVREAVRATPERTGVPDL